MLTSKYGYDTLKEKSPDNWRLELFKKKYHNLILVTSLMSLLSFLFGCPQKPPVEASDIHKELKMASEDCASVFAPEELEEIEFLVLKMNALSEKKKFKEMRKKALEILPQLEILSAMIQQKKGRLKDSVSSEKQKAERSITLAMEEQALKYTPSLMIKAQTLYEKGNKYFIEPGCHLSKALDFFQTSSITAYEARMKSIEEKEKLWHKEQDQKLRIEQIKEKEEKPKEKVKVWTVSEGENLWVISSKKEVLENPLLWPLIFWANRSQIKDPNLIYQNQKLKIPRDLQKEDIEKAIKAAKVIIQSSEYD